jgi:uncharacterized protein YkwD
MTRHRHAGEARARALPPRLGTRRAALAALAAAALACAAAEANRRSPGKVEGGNFTPTRPAATQYGPEAASACPSGGAFKVFGDELTSAVGAAQGKEAPKPDGRLCAAADALLGWDQPDPPPESLSRFVASYFGIPSPPGRVIVTTLESEDSHAISDALLQTATNFAQQAKRPRYGLATQRINKSGGDRRQQQTSSNATKVALVMQDAAVELDQPVPRQVPAGGKFTVSGKAFGGANPKVLACTPSGKLETPAAQQGDAFRADLTCDGNGPMQVEVRGDKDGATATLARFAVGCGAELPKSHAVSPPPAAGQASPPPAEQEKKMFEALNAMRTAAGLKPLEWDGAVAQVARGASQSYRDESSRGTASKFDVGAQLKQEGIPSLNVLQNPLAAPDVTEAEALVGSSPVNRCNLLNRDVTHAGVGVVQATDPNGHPLIYVTELLVRELPQMDTEQVRMKLRDAINQKRQSSRAGAVTSDATLEEIAQKYAEALAASNGKISDQQDKAITAPLYRAFRSVEVLAGVKADPIEMAEEPGVTKAAKVLGVGAAQGANEVLGKNAVYVVILVGSKR